MIIIKYPKKVPYYTEESDFSDHQIKGPSLFPLSQYKFKDPCKCDKCLIRMACTQICEDKEKHIMWKAYIQWRKKKFRITLIKIKHIDIISFIISSLIFSFAAILLIIFSILVGALLIDALYILSDTFS